MNIIKLAWLARKNDPCLIYLTKGWWGCSKTNVDPVTTVLRLCKAFLAMILFVTAFVLSNRLMHEMIQQKSANSILFFLIGVWGYSCAIGFCVCLFNIGYGFSPKITNSHFNYREGLDFYWLLCDFEKAVHVRVGYPSEIWNNKKNVDANNHYDPPQIYVRAVEWLLQARAKQVREYQRIPWRKDQADQLRMQLIRKIQLFSKILPVSRILGYYFEDSNTWTVQPSEK